MKKSMRYILGVAVVCGCSLSASAQQLKADKVRSYMVEKDGKKFMMMAMTDDRIGDFGCHIDYRFMPSNK